MCVIIIKDKSTKKVDSATLLNASIINPHGLGVLWLDSWKLEKTDSENWHILQTDRPYIAHFRYATVGAIDFSNIHPFNINKDNVLFQNGTIRNLWSKEKTDTELMANNLSQINPKLWGEILELTECRFVTANLKKRTFEIYNRELWTVKDKVYYSKQNVLDKHFVAVYGTLKYEYSNYHHYLSEREYFDSGETVDKYPLIIEGLPYVYPKKGIGHNIEVDVFHVGSAKLKQLDLLEGHPDWYKRTQIPIQLFDGKIIQCWIYFNDTIEYKNKQYHPSYLQETKYKPLDNWNWEETEDWDDNEVGQCTKCFDVLYHDEFEQADYCLTCDKYYYEELES